MTAHRGICLLEDNAMLKDILNQKCISLYKAAKETGIPYSTLSDIVSGKTQMDSVAAGTVLWPQKSDWFQKTE